MDANGITTWQNSEAGQQLAERLKSEKTLNAMDKILARIDTLEQAVRRLSELMTQGPGLLSMAADMADETYKQAADRGVYLEERMGAALQLAERLTETANVKKLNALLDLSDQIPGLIAMGVDTIDEGYRWASAQGLDLGTLSNQGITVLKKLSEVLSTQEFDALMESGVLSPKALKIIGQMGGALTESQAEPIKPVGALGMIRALGDPDRKRAIGFLMQFTKKLGAQLK